MKRQNRKPAWRKVRLPTAPPGRCHGDASKYNRQQQPKVEELVEEYEADEEEEGIMFMHKCKRFCADTFETIAPVTLGLVLGFLVLMPILQYAQEKVYPKISEAWSMVWNFGETARVVKSPTDDVLAEVLEDAGFDVVNGHAEGQIRFTSGLWTATLFNENYRIKMIAGFKGTKLNADDLNKWNNQYLYTRIYSDWEGDSTLQADLFLGDEGVSRDALTSFCRMYGAALDTFAGDRVKETLTNFLRKSDQDKAGKVGDEVSL
jgi:hypothetical protein